MSRSKKTKAVALRYQLEEDIAPVVIASGYGTVAEKIIEIAEQKGIPVFRDDSAASLMCMLDVGRSIPTELYEVVAAIYTQILSISENIKHYADAVDPRTAAGELEKKRLQNAADSKIGKMTEDD